MGERVLDAVVTGIEVALPAVMELISFPHAEVTLSLPLEGLPLERVLVVAGLQSDRPALETEHLLVLLLAVPAPPLDDLLLVASPTLQVVVLVSFDVDHHMVCLAFLDYWSLLISTHRLAVLEAFLAQPRLAVSVVLILFILLSTPHAAIVDLLPRLSRRQVLVLVLQDASVVPLDVQDLAAETETLVAVGALLGTLPFA